MKWCVWNLFHGSHRGTTTRGALGAEYGATFEPFFWGGRGVSGQCKDCGWAPPVISPWVTALTPYTIQTGCWCFLRFVAVGNLFWFSGSLPQTCKPWQGSMHGPRPFMTRLRTKQRVNCELQPTDPHNVQLTQAATTDCRRPVQKFRRAQGKRPAMWFGFDSRQLMMARVVPCAMIRLHNGGVGPVRDQEKMRQLWQGFQKVLDGESGHKDQRAVLDSARPFAPQIQFLAFGCTRKWERARGWSMRDLV